MPTQYYTRDNITFGVNVRDGENLTDSDLDGIFAQAKRDRGRTKSDAALRTVSAGLGVSNPSKTAANGDPFGDPADSNAPTVQDPLPGGKTAANGDPYGDPAETGEPTYTDPAPIPAAQVKQMRRQIQAHDSYLQPRNPAFEKAVADYRQQYFGDPNDKSDPNLLLQQAVRALPNERLGLFPPNWSEVGKAAVLREAYARAGQSDAQLRPLPERGEPNAAQKAIETVGHALSTPASYVKAGLYMAGQAVDPDGSRAWGVDTRTPRDKAEMQRLAGLDFPSLARALQEQPLNALGQPDEARQRLLQYQRDNLVGQGISSAGDLAANMALDPLSWATAGAAGLLGKAPLLSKAITGGFVGAQAAPYLADPSQILADPAKFAVSLPLILMGANHLLTPSGAHGPMSGMGEAEPITPSVSYADATARGYRYGSPAQPLPEPGALSTPDFDAGAPGRSLAETLAPADFQQRGVRKPGAGRNTEAAAAPAGLDDYLSGLETTARAALDARAKARQAAASRSFTPAEDPGYSTASAPTPVDDYLRRNSDQASAQARDQAAPSPPATVADVPTSRLRVNPDVFQYKVGAGDGGATGSIPRDVPYNPDLAGTLSVWKDARGELGTPGQDYVVNGHNRFGKAQQAGVDSVPVRYLDAPDAATARYKGALINIAEGQGTALDAAKIFREKQTTPQELQQTGLPVKGKLASDGLALSKLDDFLYRQVANGSIPEPTGAAIGRTGLDPAGQRALFGVVDRAQKAGKTVSPADIEQLAHDVRNAPTATTNTDNLFGAEGAQQQNLALEKAQLAAHVKARLAEDQRLFGGLTKQSKAEALARGNNVIDTDANAKLAGTAARHVEAFDQARRLNDPAIDHALNEAALHEAQGANKQHVREQLYRRVQQSLSAPDAAGTAGGAPGRGAASAGDGLAGGAGADLFADNQPSTANAAEPAAAPHALAEEAAASGSAEPLTAVQRKQAKRAAQRASLDAAEQAVKERLQKRPRGLQSGVDPADLADLATLGAIKIAKGAHTFADFADQMRADIGDHLTPHLQEIWTQAQARYHADIAPRFNLPRVEDHASPATETPQERPLSAAERKAAARAPHEPRATPERAETPPGPQEAAEPARPADRQKVDGPARAGNINLDRLDTSEDVKAAIRQTVSENAADIEKARGGRISHDETVKTAKALGLTEKQLKAATPPGAGAAYHVALRQLLTDSAETLQAARAAYADSPTEAHQIAFQKAAASHQTLIAHVAGHAAEAGRTLSAYRVLADAFRGAEKADPVAEMFQPVREAVNPRSRDFGSRNKLFTADRAQAAQERLRQNLSRLNSGIDPSLIPDLIEVGGHYVEGGLREFGAWASHMRATISDKLEDTTLQHVWANVKAEATQRVQRQQQSSVFVEQLSKRIGRDGAQGFVNAIADADGSPALLEKLLRGQTLTEAEGQQVASAYLDHQPTRATPKQQAGALSTVNALVAEARQERAVAAKQAKRANQPPPTDREQFERTLAQRYGKAGAERFLQDVPADVVSKMLDGQELSADQKQSVADAHLALQRPRPQPQELDAASATLKDIVAESRKQAQQQNSGSGKPNAPTSPADLARKILLSDSKADADRIAAKLADVDPHDTAAINKIMREESKIPVSSRLIAYWKAGLLSSFRTINKILLAHGCSLVADDLTHLPASVTDMLVGLKTGERTTVGLHPHDLATAAFQSATQGVKEAVQIARYGEEGATRKGMQDIGSTRHDLFGDIHVNSKIGNAYINIVTRAHGAAYRPARLYAFTRAAQSLARLQVRAEGLTGAEATQRVNSLLDNLPEDMAAQAATAAERAVYLNHNQFTDAMQRGKSVLSPGGKAVVDFLLPFGKVGSNIFLRTLEYGGGEFYAPARLLHDYYAENGVTPEAQKRFSETFGRGLTGAGLIAFGAYMASKGAATGYAGGKRGDDVPEGAIRVHGRWYQISKMAPVGSLFALGASLHEVADLHQRGKPVFGPTVHSLVKTGEENPVLRMTDTLGGVTGNNPTKAVGSMVGSAVPQALSDLAAQMDTTSRKPKTVSDYLKNRVPGLRQTLERGDYEETNKLVDPFNSHPAHAPR